MHDQATRTKHGTVFVRTDFKENNVILKESIKMFQPAHFVQQYLIQIEIQFPQSSIY